MVACRLRCAGLFTLILLVFGVTAAAQEKEPPAQKFPSKVEVADLLKQEPLTLENWPKWRERLLVWIADKGQGTDPAFDEARKLMRSQVNDKEELPEALAKDPLAWYLLASAYLFDAPKDADRKTEALKAEKAIRKSLALKGDFGYSHRRLAQILIRLDETDTAGEKSGAYFDQALKTLDEAGKHLSKPALLEVRGQAGEYAYSKGYYALAEVLLLQILRDLPQPPPDLLHKAAAAILINPEKSYQESAKGLQELIAQHPQSGGLECYLAVCQVGSLDLAGAEQAFARARALGVDPATIITNQQVNSLGDNILRNGRAKADDKVRATRLLTEQFPQNGRMVVLYGLALYLNDQNAATLAEFDRARGMGTDPATVVINLGLDRNTMMMQQIEVKTLLPQIEEAAAEARLKRYYLWAVLGGFGFFLVVMGLLALSGGNPAPVPSIAPPAAKASKLPVLALYLFFAAFFFSALVLLTLNLGLLYLLLKAPVLQLSVLFSLIISGILAWLALDVFLVARPSANRLGIAVPAPAGDKLHKLVNEVAGRVEAEPVDEVRLQPGTEIDIHLEGPRLLGLAGNRRRILSLGYTALRQLTISELAAVLMQRFAHYRKNAAPADKFLQQRTQGIEDSLTGMWAYGGGTNYFNPFFLFQLLCYKSYTRSARTYHLERELQVDRLAGELAGGDVAAEALRKLAVDATYYEQRLKQLVERLLAQDPDLGNMYAAWDDLCGPQATAEESKEFGGLKLTTEQLAAARQQAAAETPAGAKARPTLQERLAAVSDLPAATEPNVQPAVELLEDRELLEEQLTTLALERWHFQKTSAPPATVS